MFVVLYDCPDTQDPAVEEYFQLFEIITKERREKKKTHTRQQLKMGWMKRKKKKEKKKHDNKQSTHEAQHIFTW